MHTSVGKEIIMNTKQSLQRGMARWVLVCLAAVGWGSGTTAADDAASSSQQARKPLIWIPAPRWDKDDANWSGPYDGPTATRLCMKILKDEAAKLGVELSSDETRMKEFDGILSLTTQSKASDLPCVDMLFQGHRAFFGPYPAKWDWKRKRYLLASTNDPEWLRTGLRLLKAAWQMRNARVCVVTDEVLADTVHPQLGTTFHAVPRSRLEQEIRKVDDGEAAAVAVDYMHLGRMEGTAEGTTVTGTYGGKPEVDDPVRAEKAKQETIAAARFYLGCRNLLAAEKCQGLTLADRSKYGAAPVLAFSGLADGGVAAAFDRDATLMLLMAGFLFDRPGFVHGPLARQGENAFLASHFTCPTRLAGYDHEPPASFSIGPGAEGKGLGIQVRWRKGEKITRCQFRDSRLLVTTGRVCYTDIRLDEGHRTAVVLEFENKTGAPDAEAANCVIIDGHGADMIGWFARLVDVECPATAAMPTLRVSRVTP